MLVSGMMEISWIMPGRMLQRLPWWRSGPEPVTIPLKHYGSQHRSQLWFRRAKQHYNRKKIVNMVVFTTILLQKATGIRRWCLSMRDSNEFLSNILVGALCFVHSDTSGSWLGASDGWLNTTLISFLIHVFRTLNDHPIKCRWTASMPQAVLRGMRVITIPYGYPAGVSIAA